MGLGLLTCLEMHAQVLHASGPLPSFEVVSIKPAPPPPPRPSAPPGEQVIHQQVTMIAPGPPGAQKTDRVRLVSPVRMLISNAFNLPFGSEDRVTGGPDWVRSDRYMVDAKIDDATFAAMQKLPPEQQHQQVELMEQALLAERFHLKVHFEKRMVDGYSLEVTRSGPKLTPAKQDERMSITMIGDKMTVESATIDDWLHSAFLSPRAIIDKTGLTGRYDFTLTFSDRLTADGSADSAPPFRAAVQDQLGLKLEPTKVPVEYIVIDDIQQPTEN